MGKHSSQRIRNHCRTGSLLSHSAIVSREMGIPV
ncbi:MAG: hypothetical protein IPP46_20680 [Bacteroidetes bacterium]|nr:hypothetical protein [Bacteroidota bacterium]